MIDTIDRTPPPTEHDIIKVDPVEIQNLLRSLPSTALNVRGANVPVNLLSVNITEKTLHHIFGMEIVRDKTRGFKYLSYSGFHSIDLSDVNNKFFSFRFRNVGNHVAEGYIVVNPKHLPKYKSFFRGLSREEILKIHSQALLNIDSVEESQNGKRWILHGISNENVCITTVVEKLSGEVVTFYPKSSLSTNEIKEFERLQRLHYIRLFFNPCPCYFAPAIRSGSPTELFEHFGAGGFQVDLTLVHMDTRLSDFDELRRWSNLPVTDMPLKHALLTKSAIVASILDISTRKLTCINEMTKFYLPIESIERIFFDGNERFVQYLSYFDALDILKEVLRNYCTMVNEDFQESEWEDISDDECLSRDAIICDPFAPTTGHDKPEDETSGTQWDYFGGPVFPKKDTPAVKTSKYAMELMLYDMCKTGSSSDGYGSNCTWSINTDLPVPYMNINEATKRTVWILPSNGTCYMDTWNVIIHFDPYTGIIHDFGIR